MKHITTRYQWTQERLDTVASKDICSNLLTMILGKNERQQQMRAMDQEIREGSTIAAQRLLTGDGNAYSWEMNSRDR